MPDIEDLIIMDAHQRMAPADAVGLRAAVDAPAGRSRACGRRCGSGKPKGKKH